MKNEYQIKDEAIVQAFTELMMEKGDVELISVSDIVKRAGVSRSTFYTHFGSKEDVEDIMARQLAEEFYQIVKSCHKETPGKESYVLIYEQHLEFIKEHQALASVIFSNKGCASIIFTILEAIYDKLTEFYKVSYQSVSTTDLRQTAIFWTYGVYGLLRDWVLNNCEISAAEMSEAIVGAISNCAMFYNKKF